MWHENYKEFCSISYSGATKVYKRLPQQNMWHNNNEDFLRSIITIAATIQKCVMSMIKNSILFSIHVS